MCFFQIKSYALETLYKEDELIKKINRKIFSVNTLIFQSITNQTGNVQKKKVSILLYALQNGYEDLAIKLIEENVSINKKYNLFSKDKKGISLLSYATEKGFVRLVTKLLEKEVSLKIKNTLMDNNPLGIAIIFNRKEIFNILLNYFIKTKNINQVDLQKRNLLHQAVIFQRKDIIQTLIKKKININAYDQDGYTPLMLSLNSCFNCQPKIFFTIFKYLVANGADITTLNKQQENILHHAVNERIFLKVSEEPLVLKFLFKHYFNIVSLFINKRNINGQPPIFKIVNNVSSSWKQKFDFLSQQKVNLFLQDNEGRSVLHYAAFKRFYPLLLKVQDKRVFSLQDKKGKTLFHMLIESSHLNANDLSIKVDLTLVDFSFIANIKDNEGKTALFYYVPHKEKHFGNKYILNILKKSRK